MRQQMRDAFRGDRGWLAGAGTGVLLVALVTIPKLIFIESIGYPTPFLLYFAAVMVATYRGGVFAGQVTTAICAAVSFALFMKPTLEEFSLREASALLVFCVEGLCIALVTGGFVVEKRKAQRAIAEAKKIQSQLQVVLSGVDEGITLQDAQGKTVYANRVAAQMAGCASPEEFVTLAPKRLMERFALFDTAGNPFPLDEVPGRRLLRGQTAAEVKLRVRRTDTTQEHWALLRANEIKNERGDLQYVVSIFRDVSSTQAKEAELKLAREWFRIALRSIGDAVITTNTQGRINLLNPVAEELTGWQLNEALGRSLGDVFPRGGSGSGMGGGGDCEHARSPATGV
jgi:PAS domain-containing protein